MTKTNKNILRSILLISYVIIIFLVTYGIGATYSYLNTGADRSSILHTEVKLADQYLPVIQWANLDNEGRPMDDQTLKELEKDYLNAWFVRSVAYKTNSALGIEDYYTESARKNIISILTFNSDNNTTIDGTTLEHQPKVEFFSEDGQLVVLTDYNVSESKRVLKDGKLILKIKEKSTYKVTLLLEDGFWRIRHLVKIKSEPLEGKSNKNPIAIPEIKGINYYPQATPWNMYGDAFNPKIIEDDLDIIKKSGLNSIRIFVPYEDFGKSIVSEAKIEKLKTVLDLAEKKNLGVLVTLFDFYGDYSVLDWTLTQRHAKAIVNALKNHNALLGWDIKNEPNLDFDSRGKELVLAWLENMIGFVKSEDPDHPITIGWSNAESATLLNEKLDFISFHFYEPLNQLKSSFDSLKTKIIDKPIVISEYGLTSYSGIWNPLGNTKEDQAKYHKDIQTIFSENDIQFMSWTLYDFTEIPKEVVGGLPWRLNAQKHYGFIDETGAEKPSFKYISTKE